MRLNCSMKGMLLSLLSLFISENSLSQIQNGNEMIKPPRAEKIKKELTIHGDTRIDNYYWLKERDNPKIINYLIAENNYTDSVLKDVNPLRSKLFNEIIGRIKQEDQSVPYRDNGYFYYTRYEEGKEYPVYCRKKDNLDSPEEIMLNVNEMAMDYNYYSVVGLNISPDNNILAFGVDTLSRRIYDIFFKNLKTGEIFSYKIPNTTGASTWANDSRTLFYSVKDQTLRSYKIMKHIFNTSANDKTVYEETDDTYGTYIYKTKSKKFLVIGSYSTLSAEYRICSADNPDSDFKIFNPREKEHEYSIEHLGDKFYIVTNYQAKNFRLMETPLEKTSKENWKEVIPHRDDVLLEGIEVFKNFLAVEERKDGLTNLRIISWKTGAEHYLDFGEEAYVVYSSVNPDVDTDILRFGYSSLTTPPSTYDYNMVTKEKTLLKQEEVVGGYNPGDYLSERLYAEAEDGTRIPISLVYKKGIKKEGKNPLLLYGYGSYGISTEPYFNSVRLSLLDRGFIYAIAHIRGGEELGRAWYDDGKLLKKKNTFTDFIACAEHLISERYTDEERLFALGGSAGGLLIGAVVNLRPDLFKGVVAAVPFVDIVTTMLDESIPLTTGEYDEWGNPNEKKYYDYILSYSPYDNVQAKNYPNLLVIAGLHDSQVQYWEPAKWVAKLRDMKTDNNLLLLSTDMEAGHSGASGRFKKFKDTALEYVFMLYLAGITK